MNIGIIGAGFVGRTLGKLSAAKGHQVMLSNSRGPESLFSLPYAIDCQVGTIEQAISFGDIVIIAIPFAAYRTLPADLLRDKIVIDANNYYPERDGHVAELDAQLTTTSELLARHLPATHIIKAFNAIPMKDLEADALPRNSPNRRALPLVGDDPQAKALVKDLIDELGFDAVDGGDLTEGWRFERGRPAYCVPFNRQDLTMILAASQRT